MRASHFLSRVYRACQARGERGRATSMRQNTTKRDTFRHNATLYDIGVVLVNSLAVSWLGSVFEQNATCDTSYCRFSLCSSVCARARGRGSTAWTAGLKPRAG